MANDYHKQAYYPNPINYNTYQSGIGKNNTYTAESVTFDGTRINSGFYPFGYADSHTYVGGNKAENPYAENHKYAYNGDGFDISWAVDENGDPIELDEISYIKIYNPVMFDGGSTGEKSAEISKITKVESGPSAVGTSNGLSKLTFNGKEIELQSDVYSYTIDVEGASTFEITPETENADANIYVSNKRVKSGDSAKLTAVSKLRVIVQEGQCEPIIYMLSFTNAQTPETNADLSSLTLTPGDVTKTPDNENAVSFDVDRSVASIRFTPTTAGKGASVSISGGSITEAITLENGEQSSAVSISKGKNEFTVTVTSKDLANTKTYNVTVNRLADTSSSEPDNTIRVKFSLVGDKVHYDKDKKEYTGTHSSQTWISQTSVTIPKGSTVKYLTEMMLNNAGIDYETDGIYISEIKGLAEFDNGPNSGWMYRHNGTIADEGYAARKLESGDVIKWFYTDDYTKETGYEGNWDNVNTGGSGSTIKKDEATTESTTIVKTETTVSGTTATVTTSEKNITNAITEAEKNNTSEIVIASGDTKNADTIKLEIPANSVKEIAESKDLALTVATNAGDMAISNETLNAIVEQSGNAESLNVVVETKAADETMKNTENITDVVSQTVKEPQVSSIGGEWAVLGLARGDCEIPKEYFEKYYENVKNYVEEKQGVLHDKKYTEYSRVTLALTAIGKNPMDVSGYNLITPLEDFDKTIWQGINGAIFALIALDSRNYLPESEVREKYINHILEKQTADGGWTISGDTADIDTTAMALCALSNYQDRDNVKQAIDKALIYISNAQLENGGFASFGTENAESSAQVIVALSELGISLDDERFIKNGKSVVDYLLTYYTPQKGFKHTKSETDTNLMATEQALYALVALDRMSDNKTSLYDMSDVKIETESENEQIGLPGKSDAVKKLPVINKGKTFADIINSPQKAKIEALAERGMINGRTENEFAPTGTMTRAEFAAIIVKSLGIEFTGENVFSDVANDSWYKDYVRTAYFYGVIKGVSNTEFNPEGTITKEEAAVMVGRAAKLCGMENTYDNNAVRNILAGFIDYIDASDWSKEALAFCYDNNILSNDDIEILPKKAATREQIASMLYNMLNGTKLL